MTRDEIIKMANDFSQWLDNDKNNPYEYVISVSQAKIYAEMLRQLIALMQDNVSCDHLFEAYKPIGDGIWSARCTRCGYVPFTKP